MEKKVQPAPTEMGDHGDDLDALEAFVYEAAKEIFETKDDPASSPREK